MTTGATANATAFEASDTERMVRETADAALASVADNAQLRALEVTELGYDTSAWEMMVKLGWSGFALPELVGGGGGSMLEIGQLIEAVGWAAYPSPLLQVASAAVLLGELAPADPRAHALIAGAVMAAVVPFGDIAVHEDAGRMSGPPVVVEWGAAAEALLVLCRTRTGSTLMSIGADALAGRVTPARALDNERIAIVELDGLATGDVLARVNATDGARVGDLVRLLRASEMAGGASRVLALTREYMLERHQFGVPLGSFQAVQHHLANMQIDVDAALLCAREGLSLAHLRRPIAASAAIAGYVSGRSYTRATITAAQLFGGVGAVKEHRLHHYFRRAKAMQLRLGPLPEQLRRITATAVCDAPPGPWRNG
jgi:alkylation response protein AidB-like acyl-CoA dehydrogenase